MEVVLISRDTIKPSSPTPDHLRLFKLSVFDQFAPPIYVPILLFYEQIVIVNQQHHSPSNNIEKYSHSLKKSLSDILTRFYPLAGRIKDNVFIDCNDDGVDYIEASVNCELTKVTKHHDVNTLKKFFPRQSYVFGNSFESEPILSIQVNFFECGGMAIGLCISHRIADASSLITFITGWSATARGSDEPVDPCFELASMFPPIDLPGFSSSSNTWISKEKIVTKTLVFDASKIAALQTQDSQGSSVENPSRVEVVTAFILRRFVELGQAKAKAKARGDQVVQCCSYAATHQVNLRGRMVPPLERNSFGNMSTTSITEWTVDQNHMDGNGIDLVGHLRNTVKKIDDDFVRRLEHNYLDFMMTINTKFSKENLLKLSFTSWCRFPYYDVDFGWGKPVWVASTTTPFKDVVVLMDTRSGDGIEALVHLLEEDMEEFERDPEIQALASSIDLSLKE